MTSIAFYFNLTLPKTEARDIITQYKDETAIGYSNIKIDNITHYKPKQKSNSYLITEKDLANLYKEFITVKEDSPLLNKNFNFWFYLRFNSFLQLLKVNQIKDWTNQLLKNNEATVSEIYFIDVDSKIHKVLKHYFPQAIFISSNQKKVINQKDNTLKILCKILLKGLLKTNWLPKKSKKTLIISRKKDFAHIPTSNGMQFKNKYLHYIQQKLPIGSYQTLIYSDIYSKNGINNFNPKKAFTGNFYNETILFWSMFNPILWSRIIHLNKYLKKIKHESTLLSTLIDSNHIGVYTEYIIYFNFLRFFKRNSFKNIILSDEMSPGTNAIVRAAKKCNIKVHGIQHGDINEKNPGYNYTPTEIIKVNPYPDVLFVWGKNELKYFNERYTAFDCNIVPVGNIMFDGLTYISAPKKDKFTLMLATQPQPIEANKIKVIDEFVQAVLKFDFNKINIIIRLHPREVKDYDVYKPYLNKLTHINFELDKGKELLSQLNKVDILVTSYSSIAKEALILKKHLVLIDPEKLDITGLIQKKIAHKATNANELYNVISLIAAKQLSLKQNYKNVTGYDFNQANNTSTLITNMLNKS